MTHKCSSNSAWDSEWPQSGISWAQKTCLSICTNRWLTIGVIQALAAAAVEGILTKTLSHPEMEEQKIIMAETKLEGGLMRTNTGLTLQPFDLGLNF